MGLRDLIIRTTGAAVRPVPDLERQQNAGLTLAQIEAVNAEEHAAGCHGNLCSGGCVKRTRQRWTKAGWR